MVCSHWAPECRAKVTCPTTEIAMPGSRQPIQSAKNAQWLDQPFFPGLLGIAIKGRGPPCAGSAPRLRFWSSRGSETAVVDGRKGRDEQDRIHQLGATTADVLSSCSRSAVPIRTIPPSATKSPMSTKDFKAETYPPPITVAAQRAPVAAADCGPPMPGDGAPAPGCRRRPESRLRLSPVRHRPPRSCVKL